MDKRGAWLVCGGIGWCNAVGCDQELTFPERTSAGTDAAGAPTSSGITGAGGGGDGDEATPPGRLPLPDGPIHTSWGGAAGDNGQAGEADQASGATGESGGTPSEGGSGAHPSGVGSGGDAGGISDAEVPAGSRVLFISEYLEGTGSLKALEIYALGPTSLEGCELRTYFNGKLEPARLALHGTLAAGGVQVLCSSALAAAQPTLCDRSTNLTFNGDDALGLACGGITLDVFGQIGVDPGTAWGGGATADHTLRRHCEIRTGRNDGTSPFDPGNEWTTLGADVFDELGAHACAGSLGDGG